MQPNPSYEDLALHVSGLAKRYAKFTALRGIDLGVVAGSAYGLVGANGAGKTTLIKCLLDFCSIESGTIRIFGAPHRAPSARMRLAFVPERFVPPHYLTCREFLDLSSRLFGGLNDPERVGALFDELALDRAALDRPVRQLSKGMTQKLGLASCFLARRDLYLLDEPMSGLDPLSRVAVKAVLARLVREGRTLFFTSHVLPDVEELCTSLAVLDRGGILFQGSPTALCEKFGENHLEGAFIRCIHGSESAIAG